MINPSNNDKTNNNKADSEEDEEIDSDDKDVKTPEDLSRKCALSFLEELFYVS